MTEEEKKRYEVNQRYQDIISSAKTAIRERSGNAQSSQPQQQKSASNKTYRLYAGNKTYTLNQDQVDWIRSAHKNSWADAYAYDDVDQQRKAAGLIPASYAKTYKNTELDNWLFENDLPSTKYLEKYLEEYNKVRPEQIRIGNLKSELYNEVAAKMVENEINGIYNDDASYEIGNDESGAPISEVGSTIFKNAFFDVLDQPKYADLANYYNHEVSGGGKELEDFNGDTVAYREYLLKQSAKEQDAVDGFDGMPYISYDDFMQNYQPALVQGIKAQKVAEDAFGGTVGDLISRNEKARKQEFYNNLDGKDIDDFVRNSTGDPADIIAEMYSFGVSKSKIRRAKNAFKSMAATDEEKKAIEEAFDAPKKRAKELDDIFAKHTKAKLFDGEAILTEDEANAIVADARAAGFSDDEISAMGKQFISDADKSQGVTNGGYTDEAANILTFGATKESAEKEERKVSVDEALDQYLAAIKNSTVDTSGISVADAENIVLSNLEYDENGRVTDDSMQAAMNALIASNASKQTMSTATAKVFNDLMSAGKADSYANGTDIGNLSTSEIITNALNDADRSDRTIMANEVRAQLESNGFSGYEIDQALRRAGWSDTLSNEDAARNYYMNVFAPNEIAAEADLRGVSVEQLLGGKSMDQVANEMWQALSMQPAESGGNQQQEFVAKFDATKEINPDLHRTYSEQLSHQFVAILPRVASGILSNVVNLADMGAALVTDREQRWKAAEYLSELDRQLSSFGKVSGQDAVSDVIGMGSDIATEITRMYALSAAGAGLSKVWSGSASGKALDTVGKLANATDTSSKGFNFIVKAVPATIKSSPFVLSAMGGYYAEAVEDGASLDKAALYGVVAGMLEGGLEALNADNWMTNRIGSKLAFAMDKGGKATLHQLNAGIKAIGLTSSAIGNALEEGASYTASTFLGQMVYGSDRKWHLDEFGQQALMGGLIGAFGSAAQLPNQSYARSIFEFMSENGYSAEMSDLLLAEMRYIAIPESSRSALTKKVQKIGSAALLSTEDYDTRMTAVDQAVMARNAAKQKLADTESKAEADIAAKQSIVNNLVAQLKALPSAANITGDVALEQKRLQLELDKANAALKKQIEASKQAIDSSRKDLENVELQSRRAIEKAQSDLDLHFVAMHNAFTPFMGSIMRSATKDNVQSATDTMNLLNDAMASVRAGEMPVTASKAAGTIENAEASVPSEVQETSVATDYSDGISYVDVDELSQREALELGEKLGVPVEFVDMPDGFSGEYADGIIRINRRLPDGESAALVVLKHELTHYIESSDAYNDFADFVTTLAQRLNPDVNINAVYDGYKAEYAARGVSLDDLAARREFVARFAQDKLLRDEKAIKMLVNERSGLAGRVLNWVRYQIDKMKLRGKNDAVALELLEAERLYAKAFRDAGKTEPRRNDAEYLIEYTTDNTPFVVIEEDILAGIPRREWRTVLNNTVRDRFKAGIEVGGRKIAVTGKTRRELKGSKDTKYLMGGDEKIYGDKIRSTANLDEIVKASRGYVGEEPSHERNDDVVEFARGNVLIKVGGKPYRAEVLIGTLEDGSMRFHDIVNIEDGVITERGTQKPQNSGPETSDPRTPAAIGENANATLTNNIAYADQGVNMQGQKSVGGLSWQEMLDKYGSKLAGKDPRAHDEAVPERASNDLRISDFLRSFVESDKATESMIEDVKAKVEAGDIAVYTPETNSKTIREARSEIARKSQTDAIHDFQRDVSEGRINNKTVAIGMQLLTEASARGDADTTLSLLSDLCICATETGRAVQAFSMLKQLGGVGSAYYMQKVENRLNNKYAKEIESGKMLPIKIDGTLLQNLVEAKTADEIENAEAAIAANLGKQTPLTFQQKMSNWRYLSMLANPVTHVRNFTGSALMNGMRIAKDAVSTGIERAFVQDASDRAHAVYSRKQHGDKLAYAEESFKAHKRDLTSGGKYGFETFMKQNQKLFDNKTLNAIGQFNFNALEVEDAVFLKAAYKDAMVQYMIAKNLDPASMTKEQESAAVAWASEEALRTTFRDASELARLLNVLSNKGVGYKLAVEGVMPFKKTPLNVAKRGIEYSPIGLLQGVYQLTAGVKSGKYTVAQGIDRLSAGIVGSALVGLGAFLAKLGVLRGKGEDEQKAETFLQSTGEQPYSLNVGDLSFSLTGLAPATIPLFMGVSLYEAISSQESFDMSALVDVLASSLDPLMEMSFMSSLNAALESYNQDGAGGAFGQVVWNIASSYASQYVPTASGKLGQLADPYVRTAKADATSVVGGTLDSFLRSTLKKVPGATFALEPSVNVSGEVQKKTAFGDWALDFVNKFVSPSTIKVKDKDRVNNEIIRLYESTGETDFIPSSGRKYFTSDGERFNMDAQMYTAYSVDRGEACYAAIKKMIATSSYKNASDAKKAELLRKAVNNAVEVVNDRYKEKLGVYD